MQKPPLDLVKYSYAEIWIFIKYVTRPFPPRFDKMQNHNAQESIDASFKWYEKEVTGLFLSAINVVQYFICFSMINWFSSFLFSFFLLHINVIYLGDFSQIKEIMNVNRRIIFSFEFLNDKIDDYGQYAPFYLITDPDLCELKVLFIYMILHIWQAFRLSGITFVRKVYA